MIRRKPDLSSLMNIFFVTADLGFPPRTGPQDQTLMLLRYLSEQGHRCRLVALHRPGIGVDPQALNNEIPGLQAVGLFSWKYNFAIETLLAILPGKLTGPASFFGRRNAIRRAISEAVSDIAPDIVHFDGIALAPYLGLAVGSPIVLSLTDAVSLMQRRLAEETPHARDKFYRWSCARMGLSLEKRLLPRAARVITVSPVDREYLDSHVPGVRTQHIPLAVARESLARDPEYAAAEGRSRLFFSSDLRVGHLRRGLLWFLTEVYPNLAGAVPGVTLSVVGNRPQHDGELTKAAAKVPGVTFTAWVDDYEAELRRSTVAIVPDPCGGGAKNRVLRAMATGRPVVGRRAAFEGLAFADGIGGFCCSTAGEFTDSVISLLRHRALWRRSGEAGRSLAREQHSLDVIGLRWLDLYAHTIAMFGERPIKSSRGCAA